MSQTIEVPALAEEGIPDPVHPELRFLLESDIYEVVYHLWTRLHNAGYEVVGDGSSYLFGIPAGWEPAPPAAGWEPAPPAVMLVAHYDTLVVKDRETGRHLKPVQLVVNRDVVTNANGVLGADDRAGVFAVLQAMDRAKVKPWILFTNGEEAGGWGVKQFVTDKVLDAYAPWISLMIEPDRKGFDEYVYYSWTIPKEIATFVEGFGYHEDQGTYSDVADLTEAYAIPHVNLSVGYRFQHTKSECLNLVALDWAIANITAMVDADTTIPFTRVPDKPVWTPPKKGGKGHSYAYTSYYEGLGKAKSTTSQLAKASPWSEIEDYADNEPWESPDPWKRPDWDRRADCWLETLTLGEEQMLEDLLEAGYDVNQFQCAEDVEEEWHEYRHRLDQAKVAADVELDRDLQMLRTLATGSPTQ